MVIAFYRLAIATLILVPLVWLRYRQELIKLKKSEIRLLILSGFFLSLHFAAWISSLEYTMVASSVVLVTTTPLWVALFSPLFLKEPVPKIALLGMLIALTGGIIIGVGDLCELTISRISCAPAGSLISSRQLFGDFLALIGALTAAAYIIIGRKVRLSLSLVSYIFVVYGSAAIFLMVFVFSTQTPIFGYPTETYFWLLLLAVFPQLIGHSSFNWALGYLSAEYVAISLLGEPVASTILAVIFLDEIPTTIKVLGGILILTGIIISARTEYNK